MFDSIWKSSNVKRILTYMKIYSKCIYLMKYFCFNCFKGSRHYNVFVFSVRLVRNIATKTRDAFSRLRLSDWVFSAQEPLLRFINYSRRLIFMNRVKDFFLFKIFVFYSSGCLIILDVRGWKFATPSVRMPVVVESCWDYRTCLKKNNVLILIVAWTKFRVVSDDLPSAKQIIIIIK